MHIAFLRLKRIRRDKKKTHKKTKLNELERQKVEDRPEILQQVHSLLAELVRL